MTLKKKNVEFNDNRQELKAVFLFALNLEVNSFKSIETCPLYECMLSLMIMTYTRASVNVCINRLLLHVTLEQMLAELYLTHIE